MRPGFQCDPAIRQAAENFPQCFRIRAHALFPLDLASFIQHAVPTVAIAQIQANAQLLSRNFPARLRRWVLTSFIAGLLFICASSTSITWERTPHPVRRPASSHLITTVTVRWQVRVPVADAYTSLMGNNPRPRSGSPEPGATLQKAATRLGGKVPNCFGLRRECMHLQSQGAQRLAEWRGDQLPILGGQRRATGLLIAKST